MNDIVKMIGTILLTIIISMAGFWLMIGREYITRAEATRLINVHSPYVKDKKFIMEKITDMNVTNQKLIQVMDDLRIEIAALRQTLKYIEKELEKDNRANGT